MAVRGFLRRRTKMYYRNSIAISGQEIDSLWKLEGEFMILVNDDEFVIVEYQSNKSSFYKIEKPKGL